MSSIKYFRWPFAITVAGLALAFYLGFIASGTIAGAMPYLLIGVVLSILEISLSFDNAIVNANTLKKMSALWQRRFLTWGILVAVFGMRILFPLVIVAVAAKISPFEAIQLAVQRPDEYARIIGDAHLSISAFGGTFLMMVALTYFIDEDKDVDWVQVLEMRLRKWSSIRGLEIAVVLLVIMIFASILPETEAATFMFAGMFGLLTFLGVELVGRILDAPDAVQGTAARGGLGAFLYLEVLDASFSFDGVIGAFALTTNLFLIAIGLGIGAMYVRAMTVLLVERGTLAELRYLEHGAFYSILALSVIMFAQTLFPIPELVTGLIGAGLIGLALRSSLRYNRARS
ncbi:MAG: DUF475 domain-containing protein [Rhodospirillales bacterium]|nr:DUF475 domain-containing protein [Rhodospirillales bacterium]